MVHPKLALDSMSILLLKLWLLLYLLPSLIIFTIFFTTVIYDDYYSSFADLFSSSLSAEVCKLLAFEITPKDACRLCECLAESLTVLFG